MGFAKLKLRNNNKIGGLKNVLANHKRLRGPVRRL